MTKDRKVRWHRGLACSLVASLEECAAMVRRNDDDEDDWEWAVFKGRQRIADGHAVYQRNAKRDAESAMAAAVKAAKARE